MCIIFDVLYAGLSVMLVIWPHHIAYIMVSGPNNIHICMLLEYFTCFPIQNLLSSAIEFEAEADLDGEAF